MSESLKQQLRAVLNTKSFLVNSSQFSAFVFENMDQLNWAGFYFYIGGELVLGPFQGKVACSPIALGKGVCGSAAESMRSIAVEDVHAFPGHIACDSRSQSELVVPLVVDNKLLGVFDLDAPIKARFKEKEQKLVEDLLEVFVECTELGDLGRLK